MIKNKFSISIFYPSFESSKGSPFLSQNRQFQWTHTGNVIYPVIPATAATLLKQNGYKVFWDDAIAQNLNYQQWFNKLKKNKPNLIVIESKTPVIKQHWEIINQIKKLKGWKPIIVLMGDHVTALPEESLKNSKVDYVLTGGDYDFMLLNLANHLTKKTPLESGFYFRKNKSNLPFVKGRNPEAKRGERDFGCSGKFALKHHNLDSLPIIDRKLTQWHLYAYNNTNYKYKPGAYIMSGRDCWWGKCSFCSWTTLYPGNNFRCFSVKHTIAEIENLVNNFKVKEIFDDSGTLPVGPWLKELCQELINRGLNKKVKIGCNMRFGALNQDQYNLMKRAGFRFILYGLESANQSTLEKINKNNLVKNVLPTLKMVQMAKLEPHITIMIGYPWETKKDTLKTINFAKQIFKQGLTNSMQATIVIPYPGTPLFAQCQKSNLLETSDWEDYDMQHKIMSSSLSEIELKKLTQELFKGIITPKFIFKQIISVRSVQDVKHLGNYAVKFIQKLKDFSTNDN